MICWFTFLFLLPFVSAFPLEPRASSVLCSQYETASFHPYSLLANHWGVTEDTTGSQCSTFESIHGEVVIWHTDWDWKDENGGIKSFSNIQLNVGINQTLSAISSMEAVWHWSLHNVQGIVANVAFDFFTSHTAGGSNLHELMLWIGKVGAEPISTHVDSNGKPIPVASNLDLAGHQWDFYRGNNGQNEVFSFVAVNGDIRRFEGDVYNFFKYLIKEGYVSSSEYLITAQAGAEVTCGSATLTSTYKLTID